MKLEELIYQNEYSTSYKITDIEINNITTSPQKITDKTLFVVIKSIRFDINKIMNYILCRKPAALICDYELPENTQHIPVLYTKNSRKILPFLYSRFYKIDYEKMTFIAVTGTNGKTTTATMIEHILKTAGKAVGFIGTGRISVNGIDMTNEKYSMTTPDPDFLYSSIKRMEELNCYTVVMEVSSHSLYFDKVAAIPFKISVFTNLTPEHLDFHKNMDNYYMSKLKLFKQTETGIFNVDDSFGEKALNESSCPMTKSIGIIKKADICATDIFTNGLKKTEYIYNGENNAFNVIINLPGTHNIYNSLFAITVSIQLGINPCTIQKALSTLLSISGRFEIIKDEITVIIDYAHTAEAMKTTLKTLKSNKNEEQNLICVFGCGGERDKFKRPKMAEAAEEFSDYIIVTTDNSRNEPETDIIKDILSGFTKNAKKKVIASRTSAIEEAVMSAIRGDIVAVIGKGNEKYILNKTGYHDFDERKIIETALKKRKTEKL